MDEGDFELAASVAKSVIGTLKLSQVLELYGLYKQATLGDNTTPKPSWFNLTDKQKWEAWTAQKGKDRSCAKEGYVRIISEIKPDWKEASGGGSNSSSWVHHSLLVNTDCPLAEEEKTVFDWVKEDDVVRLRHAVSQGSQLDMKDQDGLTPLHWAADRGHEEVLQILLTANVDVNIQDLGGQTPLHYAASCGHENIVKALLKCGADVRVPDEDGCLAKDVAASQAITDLFS